MKRIGKEENAGFQRVFAWEKMGISEKTEDGLFLENEVFRLEEEIRKSTRIFLGHSGRRR